MNVRRGSKERRLFCTASMVSGLAFGSQRCGFRLWRLGCATEGGKYQVRESEEPQTVDRRP